MSGYEDVLEEYANPEMKLMKLVVNSGDSMEVTLPIKPNSENNYTIDWGDGTKEKVEPMAYATHTYSSADTEYTVTIDGTVKAIDGDGVFLDSNSVIKVEQWGELGLTRVNFGWCNKLVEIASPTKNSFKDVTDFSYAFIGTRITTIPENLFANCPNVTDFSYAFDGTGITSIPENLFANCPNVTNFSGAFRWTKITKIPESLFANCPNAISFTATFAGTEITTIPEKLFDNCMKVESFVETFVGCGNLKGMAIELWTRGTNESSNDYKGTPDGEGCFSGDTQLDNYDQIPEYWLQDRIS